MATKVEIVSNAFILLGGNPISSFSEGTEGLIATALYDSTYEALLSVYRWRFASVKHKLSRLTEVPINEYQYIYQLPSDVVTVIGTFRSTDYEIYGDKLYSNTLDLEFEYVQKVDETLLPVYFRKTLEFLLAAQFAVPLTDNTQRGVFYNTLYEAQFKKAKNIDSSSRPAKPIASNPFNNL